MIYTEYEITVPLSCSELLSDALAEGGFEGVEVVDGLPLTEAELKAMFTDIPAETSESDGFSRLKVYVPEGEKTEEEVRALIGNAFEEVRAFLPELPAIPEITRSSTKDEDWANNWKAYFHGFQIGDLHITPSWETAGETPEPEGRAETPQEKDAPSEGVRLLIDPGAAFGTGAHETTRLCIEELQSALKDGKAPGPSSGKAPILLDIGTGSGILSIVGMLYGAGGAVGVDLDPMALGAARENAEKNGIPEEKFTLIRGNLLEEQDLVQRLLSIGEELYGDKQFSGFPLICGNLLAEVLIAMAPCFPKLLCHNGLFLGSGILKEKAQAVEKAFLDAGLIQCRTRFLGDWAMVSAKKPWPER